MVGSLPDCCARAMSGQATALPSAAINSRRPIMAGMYPSRARAAYVKGTIACRERAVFTFGWRGRGIFDLGRNDGFGSDPLTATDHFG